MLNSETQIEGGFQDPVLESQTVFRSIMNAMAQPGTIEPLRQHVDPPAGLSASAAAIACTLADGDTPLWLDEALADAPSVRNWLAFQTGAPFEDEASLAHFAIVGQPKHLPAFEAFAQGTQDYPDRSTTLIIQVDTLTDGETLSLSGPGIAGTATFAPSPLPAQFSERWAMNGTMFPRGVDLILAAPESLACLPRTTRAKPLAKA